MQGQPSRDVREELLRYRAEWPESVRQLPAHIGTWDWLPDNEFCGCERCRTYLCGVLAPVWRDLADPAATDRAWHISFIEEEPSAFEDEPFCGGCLAGLADRQMHRTREELVHAEWQQRPGPSADERWDLNDLRRSWPTL